MKKISRKIIFLLLLSITFTNNISSQNTINIDCKTIEKPLIATKGQMLNIVCDTSVIITINRYKLYEKARTAILSTDFDKYNELFDAYDTQARFYKQWNDSLQLKYTDINTMFKKSLEDTKSSLNSINNNLSAAKDSLNVANGSLNDALVHLKAAKYEKWYYGAIGFLVGTLATVLLVTK